MEIKSSARPSIQPAKAPTRSPEPAPPAAPAADPVDSVQLSPEARALAAEPDSPEPGQAARPDASAQAPQSGNAGVPSYSVQEGDTLSALAEQWGVSVEQIARANGIANPDEIQVGQPLSNPGAAAPSSLGSTLAGLEQQIAERRGGYSVQEGDTLSALAEQWGVSVEQIAQANGIADPNQIQVGQSILNPGFAGTASAAPPATPAPPQSSPTELLPGAAEVARAERAGGSDAGALSQAYREQTVPQIVNVNGVAIPVYGARTEADLAAITQTLQNSAGVGPEVLNGVTQINLYDPASFESPAFYAPAINEIFVTRPTPGQAYFPNLNHEFGHMVDGQVDGRVDGQGRPFGTGPSANSYGETGAVEDFAVSFDYATAGFVEGQAAGAAADPETQAKVEAAMQALEEYRRRFPLEANLAAA